MITDAVVPVAGLGTRLLPATRSQPKEMLPIVDKPVVHYVVEELAAAGIERILFVTGRRKRAIEDHFDGDPDLGLKIFYTRQSSPRGLGDAVAHAADFSAQDGVVVALGDAIVESRDGAGVVRRLIDAYEAGDAAAALAVAPVPDGLVSRYGIVVGESEAPGDDPFEVLDVVEKPDPRQVRSRYAVMGRYVVGPAVFEALARTEPDASDEVQLTDALRLVVRGGGRLLAVPLRVNERRHDVGTVESYCATFLAYALRDPRVEPVLRDLFDGRG